MALVTVTFNAWDHNRQVVPAAQQPEIWFRPVRSSLANGLMTDRAVKATLNPATGAGQVQLESAPDLLYVPEMRWLLDRNVPDAHDFCEWDAFNPSFGGPIDQLPGPPTFMKGIWFGFGDPPQALRVQRNVVYFDISGLPDGYPVLWFDQTNVVGGGA